ncbi:MAG: LysM peptidoglycan-binding domain-containing protein [Pseudomonadota bacterium]
MINAKNSMLTALTAAALCAAALAVAPVQSAAASTVCGPAYTVERGDTFSRIAKKCDVTVQALAAANADLRDPSRLSVGQRLAVPGTQAGPAATPTADEIAKLSGTVINGRRCALIETADGARYGLRSSKLIFVSGRDVVATGVFSARSDCGVDRTMIVRSLEDVKQ